MKKIVFGVICAMFLSGCATIISGTKQTIVFSSQPEGAQVLVDGISVGVTPLTIELKKNKHSVVEFRKDGYATQNLPMGKSFDGVTLLSVFWDLGTTDILSGAAWEYSPNRFHAIMQPKSTASLGMDTHSVRLQKLALTFGDDIRRSIATETASDAYTALIKTIESAGYSTSFADLSTIAENSAHDLALAQNLVKYYSPK